MTVGTEPLTERPAWKALKAHYDATAMCTCESCSRMIRGAAKR